jgi:hypothetical protein
LGLSLSDWLGLVLEKTLREPARGNPAMHDAGDRGVASADGVQKACDGCMWAERDDSVAASTSWQKRGGQACENTELQASADC